MTVLALALLFASGWSTVTAAVAGPADSGADAAFPALAADHPDRSYLHLSTTIATGVGIHRYDDRLEGFSAAGARHRTMALRAYLGRVDAVDPASPSEREHGDRDRVASATRSQLLTLRTIRPLQKDPGFYPSGIAASAHASCLRDFAPAAMANPTDPALGELAVL